MGSLFASKIASNNDKQNLPYNVDVWLISSWSEHIENIKKNGLAMESVGGDSRSLSHVNATASLRDVIANGPVDIIFILVKAPYTRIAAEKVQSFYPVSLL